MRTPALIKFHPGLSHIRTYVFAKGVDQRPELGLRGNDRPLGRNTIFSEIRALYVSKSKAT